MNHDGDQTDRVCVPDLLRAAPQGQGQEKTRATRAPRRRAYLVVLSGPLLGESFRLRRSPIIIGRSPEAQVRVPDQGVSRLHAQFQRQGAVWVLEDLGSTNGTRVNGQPVHRTGLRDGDRIQLGAATVLKLVRQDVLEESFQRQLYDAALRDGLTQAFNRRYFLDRLRSEVAFAARHGDPLSLLLLDVDLFKGVNDRHGHLTGDRALQTIADAVSRTIRSEDVLARFGGEEFAVICRGVALGGAYAFAERVRRTVEALRLRGPNGVAVPLTVSVGVAELPAGVGAGVGSEPGSGGSCPLTELFIALADRALYAAKAAGRNCVRVAARPGYWYTAHDASQTT